MIMVIGGRCQGKASFAREHFKDRSLKTENGQKKKENNSGTDTWADGETVTWEEFLASAWCRNFHLLVRRILKRDESLKLPLASERETERRDKNQWEVSTHGIPDWKKLAESIYNANPDRILVTDEIGYGIVPIDAFEREYREETGRICCLLAEKSEEVWRVCCGLGQRLK